VIRPVRAEDLPGLVTLCAAHAAYERTPFVEDGHERRWAAVFFGGRPRAWCLVVEDEGALVGYATWSLEFSTWSGAEYVHVDCLYLEPGHRGRGLGRSLMLAIAGHSSAEGRTLEWQTPAWNTDAVRFYRRLGADGAAKIRFSLRSPPRE